jgi:divalent metal cation (Fe/Co/Zn/Cd) transporter
MTPTPQIVPAHTLRHIHQIQAITIVWMSIEAGVSLFAASRARSPALLAFGGDSAIELLSAVVVLWSLRPEAKSEHVQLKSSRIAGALLLLLTIYVTAISVLTLLGYSEPKRSVAGIAVLLVAATIMPVLAKAKLRLSQTTGSAVLRADAAESALCGYLSVIALVGVLVMSIWGIRWADPIAALAIVPLIIYEAREAIQGKACC